jgi:phosphatidylcholine synthase
MTAAPRPLPTEPRPTREITARAWCVHGITASGVILGAFGLEAVVRDHPRAAILWLVAAMIIDGIDGPVARAWNVESVLPTVDGNVLDLVVDYLTCVVVPVAFMAHFHAFPPGFIVPMSALILFTAVLWFARRDLMTEDHWFRGFPAIWNLVAPSFFLLHTSTGLNVVITVVLCVLTLTSVKFVHPVQVQEHRSVNIGVTALWLAAMVWLTLAWPETPVVGRFALIAAPAWFIYITVMRTWRGNPVTHDPLPT